MTNNTTCNATNRSLMIRWIAATSIVAAVGCVGFVLRGEGSHRRESSPPTTTTTTLTENSSFLEIPELPVVDTGMGLASDTDTSSSEPTLTDFSPCDSPPAPLRGGRRDWSHYATQAGSSYDVEFDHPRNWHVSNEGDQIAAVSPDGERAFIVQVVPFPVTDVSMVDLFSTMQNMHPERDYSDPRPVVVDGKPGCVASATGEGHSGEIGLLRGDGFMVVVTAAHELDPDTSALSDAWALIGSVRVGA
jgi:hypothetical protein